MAGDRVLARASYCAVGLLGLLAGTLALLWSLCQSWIAATLQVATLELSADSTTLFWLHNEAGTHALKAGFLAWCGWLVLGGVDTQDKVERWRRYACRDPLTGIANRRALKHHWYAMARERRTFGELTVLTIDLDNFKQLNDRYGHDVGDQALCRVASILEKSFQRRSDRFVGRTGGDEFIVVLPVTSAAHAARVRRRIVRRLRQVSLLIQENIVTFSASVGAASRRFDDIRRLEDLARLADQTLLNVKRKRQYANRRCSNQR